MSAGAMRAPARSPALSQQQPIVMASKQEPHGGVLVDLFAAEAEGLARAACEG